MSEKLSVLTGATGHVGYALLKELEKSGENVRILIRKESKMFDGIKCEKVFGDVTDYDSLVAAFKGADVVYHLAGIIDINSDNEDIIWNVNVEGTKKVVKACKACGVKRLVYTSSVDAFPPLPDNAVMTELSHFDPDILDGTYAKTKAVATQYVLDNRGDGLEIVVGHPGACTGPYDFKTSSIGEMVRMFVKGKFPVSLAFGAYNFVDVRDVAKGLYAAASKGRDGECYILTGEYMTTDALICMLSQICGQKAPGFKLSLAVAKASLPAMKVYYKLSKATPLFTSYSIRKLLSNCNFSCDKARRELGYDPMSNEQSFTDMVAWIKEYENIK